MSFFNQNIVWKDCLYDEVCVRFVINIKEVYEPSAFES